MMAADKDRRTDEETIASDHDMPDPSPMEECNGDEEIQVVEEIQEPPFNEHRHRARAAQRLAFLV